MIKNFKKLFARKKECNYSEKLIFLVDQTNKWFFDNYSKHVAKNKEVNIPAITFAKTTTKIVIDNIVKNNLVDYCFEKCVKEMQTKGQTQELIKYGII